MNSPHLDIEERVGREVRAGQDNLQVIAAERHAVAGFGFVECDGRELTADLCLRKVWRLWVSKERISWARSRATRPFTWWGEAAAGVWGRAEYGKMWR